MAASQTPPIPVAMAATKKMAATIRESSLENGIGDSIVCCRARTARLDHGGVKKTTLGSLELAAIKKCTGPNTLGH